MTPDARIQRDGRSVALARLTTGDYITARYRETPQGLMLVTDNRVAVVETPEARAVETPAPTPLAAVLPKTGSQDFAWLFVALALAVVGIGIKLNRG